MSAGPHEPSSLSWRRAVVDGRPARYGVGGTGPPLVFLHGWGLGHRSYERALCQLVDLGLQVHAPALPGFGGTADLPAEEFSLAGYARWVAAFMEELEIPAPTVLVGHSFGGGVAIRTAADDPDRIGTLVVVNSIGGSAWSRSGGVVRSMAERPIWDWGLHLQADLWPVRQATRVLPVVVEDAVRNVLRNPRALWRVGRLAASADLTDELEQLKQRRVPVVVLWGDSDRVIPYASFESLRTGLGDPRVHTVPGNHSWLLADPAGFGEIMTNVVGVTGPAPPAP